MMLKNLKFAIVLDFDRTVADTFELSPNGLGVEGAYEHAIECVFGRSALGWYCQTGGLKNRAPREIVESLQEAGYGRSLTTAGATEQLIAAKISCIGAECGQVLPDGALWPRLITGFEEYWNRVTADVDVVTAILSSGHRAFIQKTFEIHTLKQPDFMLTDDELRTMPGAPHKPDPKLWQLLVDQIVSKDIVISRSVYIGDDPVKDGELIVGLPNVKFFLCDPDERYMSTDMERFSDWSTLRTFPDW